MLLRNMEGHDGACNGTQLIVKYIGQHVLVTEFARGQHKGQILALPRIPLSPSDSIGSIQWIRRQFPVNLSFAITINKAQGQTLRKVGVFLPRPVFSHGQIYVALITVGSPDHVSVHVKTMMISPMNIVPMVVSQETWFLSISNIVSVMSKNYHFNM